MLIAFVILASSSSGDLLPPFVRYGDYVNAENWLVSGSVDVSEDQLLVVPPVARRSGSVWSTAEYPSDNFSALFALSLLRPRAHGGFCVWLSRDLVPRGPFFGGPARLDGVALVAEVASGAADILNVHLLQSDGTVDLWTAVLPKPIARIRLYDGATDVVLRLTLRGGAVAVDAGYDASDMREVAAVPLACNVTGNYLGVSAATGDHPCGVALRGVAVSELGSAAARPAAPNSADAPARGAESAFRSPELRELSDELALAVKFDGDVGNAIFRGVQGEKVFRALDALVNVTAGLATHYDLVVLLGRRLGNFSAKWSKRKRKIIDEVHTMEAEVKGLDQTSNFIEAFKKSIHEILVQSKKKAIKFGDVANEVEEYGLSVFEGSESKGMTKVVKLLMTIAVVESICVVFLFIQSTYRKKRKSVIPLDRF